MESEESPILVAKCMQCNEYPCNPSTQLCFYCKSYSLSDLIPVEIQNDDEDTSTTTSSSAEKTTTTTTTTTTVNSSASPTPSPSLKRKRSDMQVNEAESETLLFEELLQQIQFIHRQADHLEQLLNRLMKKDK